VGTGTFENGLPYLVFGSGPPLVVLRPFSPLHNNPSGVERLIEIRPYASLADRFTVYSVNRGPGLPRGVTMAEIAAEHATAIREIGDLPLDVVGLSTGGSVALQLAADHPDLVRRLVIAGSAHRLGANGSTAQEHFVTLAMRGRRALPALAPILARHRIGRVVARGVLWLGAPSPKRHDYHDAVAVLRAEDAFDLSDRLPEITAPTLVIGGANDLCYEPRLFTATAEGVADGRLILYRKRGHMGTFFDRRFAPDVSAFLAEH
jgi:pimeloyl-ACP methyl ester carboxylesterase